MRLNGATNLGVVPDNVFALDVTNEHGDITRAFFFLEADRGTMPIVRKNLSQTSFYRKLLAYVATWNKGLHRTLFGFHRFRVLIATTSSPRTASIIGACSRLKTGHGLFLFCDEATIKQHGNIFTIPWKNGKGENTTLQYSYEGMAGRLRGRAFKLGPKVIFEANDPTVDEWIRMFRVLYADGGMFAHGVTYPEFLTDRLSPKAPNEGAINVGDIRQVLQEWREPRHPEFETPGKTAWRLFNAATEAIKGDLWRLPVRTTRLHSVLDVECGVIGADEPAPANLPNQLVDATQSRN